MNLSTHNLEMIDWLALDWVRDNDFVVFLEIDAHLDAIKENVRWGDEPLEAIVNHFESAWRNGPPGFTTASTTLVTKAMEGLAREISWDKVVMAWLALNPEEHGRLERLVS